MPHPVALLRAAYDPLLTFAQALDDARGWTPTSLPGWTVRDVVFHLLADARRALVAIGTPTRRPVDTDHVSYWSAWKPDLDPSGGPATDLRMTRISASVWTSVRGPADAFTETARALLQLAARADPADVVFTQGHTMTVETLLRTLVVELAVHHLDLAPTLSEPPAPQVLAEVRRTLDGLLGVAAPAGWDDVRYARLGTGRTPLSDVERGELGVLADRFPLFG